MACANRTATPPPRHRPRPVSPVYANADRPLRPDSRPMSHEIYYTSAPEGARPGQRGFCTVATSAGIPRPLWDRLESLSGYRHHFTGSGTAARNPVAWAHWLIQLQGRDVNVLSRVCDAGFD